MRLPWLPLVTNRCICAKSTLFIPSPPFNVANLLSFLTEVDFKSHEFVAGGNGMNKAKVNKCYGKQH
jgi:hypothetical protein